MSIKKYFFMGLACLIMTSSVSAQYFKDALKYTRTSSIGTARTQAIGGAQVALGGDINAAYANPAGLGFNRSSVVTFTPSMNFYNADMEYFGDATKDSKANFNIANLGVIFNFAKSDVETSKFKGGSFAITMTRENNFHQNINYDGYNDQVLGKTSIVDSWIDQAWGVPVEDLGALGYPSDAFNHYLINDYYETSDPNFTRYDKFIGDYPRQIQTLQNKGSQYQWDFAAGGNYDDILYFGASLGLNSIKYSNESLFIETEYLYNDQPDEAINEVSTKSTFDIRGTGVSGTFGLIVRPHDIIRLGISATTPTYYWIYEEASEDLFTSYNSWEYFNPSDSSTTRLEDFYDEYFTESNYNIKTPFRLTTGLAIFLGKAGFISADIDFLDYSKAKLSSSDFQTIELDNENQNIKSLYQNTINWRVGTEFRVSTFRIRGGYSYEGDPYKGNGMDNSIRKISGGLGYRNKAFFVDLSAVHSKWSSTHSPYTIYSFDDPNREISPTAAIENKNLNISLTFGVNF